MLLKIAEHQDVLIPIGTFVLGFFASRFTLSKSDRLSHEAAQFALSKELAESQSKAYQALMQALTKFVSEKGKNRTLDDFFALSGPANDYLFQQKMVADAVLSNKIDAQSRDATFVPQLVETAEKVVPKVYASLKKIADKHNLPYPDHFDRANYQSIFDVVDKYGPSHLLTRHAASIPSSSDSDAKP